MKTSINIMFILIITYILSFTESSSVEKAASNARTDATVIQSPCPPRIPYRFTTPQGLEIDMRLCSQDKMSSVKPYLLQILNAAMQVSVIMD